MSSYSENLGVYIALSYDFALFYEPIVILRRMIIASILIFSALGVLVSIMLARGLEKSIYRVLA